MILSNVDIKQNVQELKHLKIEPFIEANVQPASLDITLSNSFAVMAKRLPGDKVYIVDMSEPIPYKKIENVDEFILYPRHFVLASTQEYIDLPLDIAADLEGRSSVGRAGVFIQNAGYIDPGFSGQITLELYNAGNYAVKLKKGIRIGQLIFHRLENPTDEPYRGKYQFQKGATESYIFKDYEWRLNEVTGND